MPSSIKLSILLKALLAISCFILLYLIGAEIYNGTNPVIAAGTKREAEINVKISALLNDNAGSKGVLVTELNPDDWDYICHGVEYYDGYYPIVSEQRIAAREDINDKISFNQTYGNIQSGLVFYQKTLRKVDAYITKIPVSFPHSTETKIQHSCLTRDAAMAKIERQPNGYVYISIFKKE